MRAVKRLSVGPRTLRMLGRTVRSVECRERVLAQLAVMAPGKFSVGGLQVQERING